MSWPLKSHSSPTSTGNPPLTSAFLPLLRQPPPLIVLFSLMGDLATCIFASLFAISSSAPPLKIEQLDLSTLQELEIEQLDSPTLLSLLTVSLRLSLPSNLNFGALILVFLKRKKKSTCQCNPVYLRVKQMKISQHDLNPFGQFRPKNLSTQTDYCIPLPKIMKIVRVAWHLLCSTTFLICGAEGY